MKRWLFGVMAAIVLLSGCTQEKNNAKNDDAYPLQTDVELTHWIAINSDLRYSTNKFGDSPFAKELEKETGVHVKYISPRDGQMVEAFNLMIASKELPDLISYSWHTGYPGGVERAVKENVIQPLTDIIPQYSPHLNAYLEEYPEVKKLVRTDSGEYVIYPFIRGDESLTVYFGPMVRRDLLEATGRQTLETLEDWHGFLTDMKNAGIEKPLALTHRGTESGFLIGAYGIVSTSYIENGKVMFGAAQPAYRDYLAMMRTWYQEGLLDKEFLIADKMVFHNMEEGSSAATVGYAGSTMGTLIKELQKQNPAYDLVGVPNPVMNRGEIPKFTQKDYLFEPTNNVAISTQCKQTALAARYLDFGYTEQGRRLYNYGIENESYIMQDGQPVYTDVIMNNPDGIPISQALALYTQNYSGPFIQEKRYAQMYYTYTQQQEAIKTWANSETERYRMPLISVLEGEYEEYSRIYTAVTEYVDQAFTEFVMGVRSLDDFDGYVEELQNLGLDRMLELQQAAYERYQRK